MDDSRGTGHKLKDIVGYLDVAGFDVYKIGTRCAPPLKVDRKRIPILTLLALLGGRTVPNPTQGTPESQSIPPSARIGINIVPTLF